MPIYEYKCGNCNHRVSLFFRSISSAESGAADARCPNCGGASLTRLVSKISVLRGNSDQPPGLPSFEGDEVDYTVPEDDDIYGAHGGDVPGAPGLGDIMSGVDEDDPRSIARWARQMQAQTGESLGPEFDTALSRIESGEDPDRVMDDLEPAMGGAADDDGGDFGE